MNVKRTLPLLLAVLATLATAGAGAQNLDLPRASQAAEVTQRIGLTDVTVSYHRPRVQERQIWGALVPYDQVWRAGANENTTVTVTDDVTIEGQPLPAGTYGLHMIPGSEEWTVIFSKNNTSWGSFFYDESEDAVRAKVKPRKAPFAEALSFGFEALEADSAELVLRWEELAVPVKVGVDANAVALASIRNQLRSIPGFTWQGYQQAAAFCLQNDVNLDEAMTWIDSSIQQEENFVNLQTKSQLLAKAGDEGAAEETMDRALALATPLQLHNYGRQLISQGESDKALAMFKMNKEKNPDVWFVDIGLARGLSAVGQFEEAAKHMRLGAKLAPENQRAIYEGMAERLDKEETIN